MEIGKPVREHEIVPDTDPVAPPDHQEAPEAPDREHVPDEREPAETPA
jgi:hypothetical protein